MSDPTKTVKNIQMSEAEIKYLEMRTATGANAIRVPGIINAAAIAVILSFIANYHFDSKNVHDVELLLDSIIYFLLGILLSAFGSGFAYWNLAAEHNYYRASTLASDRVNATFTPESISTRNRITKFSIEMARICVVISYLLFISRSVCMWQSLHHLLHK